MQLVNEDLYHWVAKLIPPQESPYYGGKFKIDIKFDNDYPFQMPKCKFITPIYHPNININSHGRICIYDFYFWSPAFTINQLLFDIYWMFTDWNP